ncbi:HepT-like ribonuclease domain-containing protein [Frigoriflavimonas asaccharolytica]|uniref:Uncharacterized protein with HEPN domain n=1 Tax=Frigoriflavimonas asaccharolytica TaxID=2735899 RepID=A0A8J8GAS7_9FLAO|nr:HepT-like ribonuclease domain-containing protein [Frigoriflavimonas asaccharolytica]NRS92212.1 uncharacterized protein with HEPN domain [Frigoriflavimonas asaccharolytica]
MMDRTTKYLNDILIAVDLIENFTADQKDFDEYQKDLKTQSAVERQLAIVGEALNNLKKINPNLNIEHSQKIIFFRNRLVHSYDNIDSTIVWAIIQRHLPQLKLEVLNILKKI